MRHLLFGRRLFVLGGFHELFVRDLSDDLVFGGDHVFEFDLLFIDKLVGFAPHRTHLDTLVGFERGVGGHAAVEIGDLFVDVFDHAAQLGDLGRIGGGKQLVLQHGNARFGRVFVARGLFYGRNELFDLAV